MTVLGLATTEELVQEVRRLEGLIKSHDSRLRELEKRPSPLKVPQTINLTGESVSLAELLEQVLGQGRPLIKVQLQEEIEEALKTMDWEDLTNRAWDAVDVDELTEKLAAALIEKVTDLVDRDALRGQLIETLLEDDLIDLGDLADRITSDLSSRLEVSLAAPED
mgnify:CR=1 FL=1